jgi:hypothetical protein
MGVVRATRPNQWIPPLDDDAKINVDTSVARVGGFGVVGAVC